MALGHSELDHLDIRLLKALEDHPRAGTLELSRILGIARATVTARMRRLEVAGVITGFGPQVDLAAAGYPVQAFVTLDISQGRLEDVTRRLTELPGVTEAYVTTGTGDVHCRIAAKSHEDLQRTLLELNRSPEVQRTTSVILLSVIVAPRIFPLLAQIGRESPNE